VFSPPSTPVRIQGDIVGRGFAVEIEDRGLGISPVRMDEINANLANPPQFDLSGSDRLGLFIAGQLAQRHDIKITLRPSVYGGTTAIVLIPTSLVVEEDTYERDPALPAGRDDGGALPDRIGGRHSALGQANSRLDGSPNGSNGYAIAQTGNEFDTDAGPPGLPVGTEAPATAIGSTASERSEVVGVAEVIHPEHGRPAWSDDTVSASDREPVRLSWSSEHLSPSAGTSPRQEPSQREPVRLTWSDETVGTGDREQVRRPWSEDTASSPSEREPVGPEWSEDGSGSQQASATGWPNAGSGSTGFPGSPGSSSATAPSAPPSSLGHAGSTGFPGSAGSVDGLPVRVRQASLAPQLRNLSPPPPADTSMGVGFYSGARSASGGAGRRPGDSAIDPFAPRRSAPRPTSDTDGHLASPEAARNTMSALQRGWQLGRSEAGQGVSPAQPPGGYSPSGSPPDVSAPHHMPDPIPADSADEHDNE
ncbi:MAG TPA: hypothetical protein VLM11_02925, partial [Streptosporangiaceae bacterium]|nr:hypothetical protein [Streptosporangiaceae bacterium]